MQKESNFIEFRWLAVSTGVAQNSEYEPPPESDTGTSPLRFNYNFALHCFPLFCCGVLEEEMEEEKRGA